MLFRLASYGRTKLGCGMIMPNPKKVNDKIIYFFKRVWLCFS